MSRDLPRVLVLTGTSDHPFPRLLDALPALVREGAAREVRVQSALPVPEAPGIVALGMLSREAMASELAAADVVITHGGSGSCFEAIRAGHRPIVVPRRRALGEHVDDHQDELASELAASRAAVLASDPLPASLLRDVAQAEGRARAPSAGEGALAGRVRALLPRSRSWDGVTPRGVNVAVVDVDTYAAFYRSCPRPHPLQSTAWGEARRIDGWTPHRWLARTSAGRALAGAQVLHRWAVGPAYLPYGPAVLEDEVGRRAGRQLVRRLARASVGGLLWTPSSEGFLRSAAARSIGVAVAPPGLTGFLPLGPDDEILARMRGKWRGSLRKGLRAAGLVAREENAATFVPLLLERVRALAAMKGFRPPVRTEVGTVFAARAPASGVRLVAVSTHLGERRTSGTLAAVVGDTARLLWTAHEEDADESSGRVALWEVLRRCRSLGAVRFDLSGIDDEGNPGVASFKRGLRPDLESVPALRWVGPAWLPPVTGTAVRGVWGALQPRTADR